MPRGLVTLFVALEALFVVGIGIGIILVPILIGWGSVDQFQSTPLDVWQLAVQVWAIGHGVPLHITLPSDTTLFPADSLAFDVTVALLGSALVTGLLAVRTGRRIAETEDSPILGAMVIACFAGLAGLALWSGQSVVVNLDVIVGTIAVTAPFAFGLLFGWKPWRLLPSNSPWRRLVPEEWRDVILTAGRITTASFLGLAVAASVVVTWCIVTGFATEISLYEAIHGQVLGGFIITAGQLLALPTVLVWTMSWLAGPGFSLGLGTLVTPFTATVGAFPAIPLLGAIPTESAIGWPVLVIPFAIVIIVSAILSWGIVASTGYFDTTGATDYIRAGVLAALSAVFSGMLFFIVGSAASGSAGPGRFIFVGVDPADIAFAWAGIVFVGSLIGAAVRLIRPLPHEVARSVDIRTR